MQVYFHRVQPQFLQRSLQSHLIIGHNQVERARSHDLQSANTAVQMPLVIGIGLDGNRLLANSIGQSLQPTQAGAFNFFSLALCFSTIRL